MDAQGDSLDEKAAEFCVASVSDRTGRAARMLAESPEIAGHSLATALMLGDVDRVRAEIERDPGAATRADPATGWTALHAVAASRWHRLDPARTPGLLATARLLLDAGAPVDAPVAPGGRAAGSSPLRCAAAAASAGFGSEAMMELLLERGAVAGDEELYLASFGPDHRYLEALLSHSPGAAAHAEKALSAPISTRDVEAVRLLLDAGADPRRFADDDGQPAAAVYSAVAAGCPAEIVTLLIDHGADPGQPGPDGHTPAWLAAVRGRDDLADLLGTDDASGVTDTARFVSACLRPDRDAAASLLAADRTLNGRLSQAEIASLVYAAEEGREPSVALMLDLGFPIDARRDDGATALHAAAYAGNPGVVRLLLERGADPEAPDGQWQSPPLEWAVIGSGERDSDAGDSADWLATVRALVLAGASAAGLSLSPDDPKPPSPEVAALLREYGVAARA